MMADIRIFISSVQAEIRRKNVGQNVPQSDVDYQQLTECVPQNVGQNVGRNVGQSKQGERYVKILNTLFSNRRAPLGDIATMLNVSERTINRDLKILRQTYRIEWVGSPKTGRWEIEIM